MLEPQFRPPRRRQLPDRRHRAQRGLSGRRSAPSQPKDRAKGRGKRGAPPDAGPGVSDARLADPERWDEIIQKADSFGLDVYPQEFEICDHNDMLGYMGVLGMLSHYPQLVVRQVVREADRTYDYGVSGLPYEMVT